MIPYNISKELSERGHKVVFYTTDYKLSQEWLTNLRGVTVYPFKTRFRKSNFFITPEIVEHTKKDVREFDVLHLHNYRTFQNVVVSHYALKYGIPYVLEAHGSLPILMGDKKIKKFFDLQFGLKMLSESSGVIAVNNVEANQYINMGVSPERVHIIPNGLDLSKFQNLPQRGLFRSKFGIEGNKKLILFLGRLHRIKGIDILVKAFASLVKEFKEVELAIVGPDDGYLDELKDLIKTLQIQKSVILIGPLYDEDKLEAYVDADIYVLPSRYEIFGMTVLESIACGTPVIVTESCGLASDLRGKVGLVFKKFSSSDLEQALLEILIDTRKYSSFKKNCKSFIDDYDLSRQVSRIESLFLEVIQEHD